MLHIFSIKNALVFIAFFASGISIAQQATIKGSLKNDRDLSNMPNVTIGLDEKTYKISDLKGRFEFGNVSVGEHTLRFSCLGFEKMTQTLKINSENESIDLKDLLLKPSAIQINEVIISASPSIYSYKYEGSNIMVTPKEIERSKPIGTEELLKKVSGINVSGDMGISNRLNVGIRGSYPRRSANILLMEDGTPIAPAPYLAPEAYYNPPSDGLDGIEVLKGADILSYGSNTMYGAINYTTKKPPLAPTLGLTLTQGENGYSSQYLTYGGTWDKVGAEIQVLNKQFDGFQDNSNTAIFNTKAKLYSELSDRSSVYLKLNYHQEKSKASYSALTPYTYALDPIQNPFDADDLETKRYAVDLIYNYKLSKNIVLFSKVYASQFQRDWWRQENTLIKASTAKSYLGEDIYQDRYSYLDGQTFGNDDYIRVGRVVSGKESTRARNRTFRVAGAQQSIRYMMEGPALKMNIEAHVKGHWETFANTELKNDSSRFARSGTIDKDQFYTLSAYSGFIKDRISYKKLSLSPSVRYEIVEVYQFDKLVIAQMSNNDGSKYFGTQKNTYTSLVPGVSASYEILQQENNLLSVFGGIYKGYNAPIADNAFLHVEDGVVSTATEDKPINRLPETSLNHEAGVRGDLFKQFANLQMVYFNNHIQNFYSAGRNEAFQTLGAVNTYGLEASINLNLHKLWKTEAHQIVLSLSGTQLNGKVLSGLLKDSDLLKAKHTDATKAELIQKINAERSGFDVYYASSTGKDSLVTSELAVTDFSKIKRLDFVFGENGIANNVIPYLPPYILNVGFSYTYKGFSLGANLNYVAKQYTDYLNFENETAEGAIGSLGAYKTIDANLAYSFEHHPNKYVHGLNVFVAAKNITNQIYASSRLHRLSSGIMPGGFRQINAGIRYLF